MNKKPRQTVFCKSLSIAGVHDLRRTCILFSQRLNSQAGLPLNYYNTLMCLEAAPGFYRELFRGLEVADRRAGSASAGS
jgi:hypothetical protein